jgi:hypothetical protein
MPSILHLSDLCSGRRTKQAEYLVGLPPAATPSSAQNLGTCMQRFHKWAAALLTSPLLEILNLSGCGIEGDQTGSVARLVASSHILTCLCLSGPVLALPDPPDPPGPQHLPDLPGHLVCDRTFGAASTHAPLRALHLDGVYNAEGALWQSLSASLTRLEFRSVHVSSCAALAAALLNLTALQHLELSELWYPAVDHVDVQDSLGFALANATSLTHLEFLKPAACDPEVYGEICAALTSLSNLRAVVLGAIPQDPEATRILRGRDVETAVTGWTALERLALRAVSILGVLDAAACFAALPCLQALELDCMFDASAGFPLERLPFLTALSFGSNWQQLAARSEHEQALLAGITVAAQAGQLARLQDLRLGASAEALVVLEALAKNTSLSHLAFACRYDDAVDCLNLPLLRRLTSLDLAVVQERAFAWVPPFLGVLTPLFRAMPLLVDVSLLMSPSWDRCHVELQTLLGCQPRLLRATLGGVGQSQAVSLTWAALVQQLRDQGVEVQWVEKQI